MKLFKIPTLGLSLLTLLALSGCATAQRNQDPWPDAQDQMAGFASVTPVAARLPSSSHSNKGMNCYDGTASLGLAKDAWISIVLVHADAGYATEEGPAELLLQTSWVARSQNGSQTRGLVSKGTETQQTPSLKLANFYTTTMPTLAETRYVLNDALSADLAQTQGFERAELKIEVLQKLALGGHESLGSLYLRADSLKKYLSHHKTGLVVSETLPLKYRGLASIETSVYCSASRR